MYLAVVGCPRDCETQGQFELDNQPLARPDYLGNPIPDWTAKNAWFMNAIACLPGVNVISGLGTIYVGLVDDPHSLGILQNDRGAFRALKVFTGVLELTLVGGWIAHGVVTIYFHRELIVVTLIALVHALAIESFRHRFNPSQGISPHINVWMIWPSSANKASAPS